MLPLSAQTENLVSSQDTAFVPAALPVIEYTMQRKVYEIAEITVSGADSYEDFVLIGFSGLAVGDKLEIPGDQITKSLKRFWKQGLFSDVKFIAKKIEGDKIWIEIALKQRPRISNLTYKGLKKSEIEDVEVKIGIQKDSQMTPDMEDRIYKVIAKYLSEKGFHEPSINVLQINDQDHPGYVKVAIDVDRKTKTRVGHIYITGNEALTENQINHAMKKTNDNNIINLFRTKKFVAEEFENDKKLIIEKYNEIGYRDAIIVSDSIGRSPEDSTRVDVYLTIDEGNKYHFGNIDWVGNTVYPYEYLNASIDFEMRMYEGQPATINEINIVGNTRVYEHVVRRELYTKPGQLYSQSDIMRSLRELAQMGHFDQENLVPDIQPNPEDGTVDVTYQLETKSSDQIEFSLGWGATGLVGTLGLKFTNFAIQNLFNPKSYRIVPQGEGQTFSINARTNGVYYTSASMSFLEPWLGGKRPNSLSANIFFASQTGYSDRYYQAYQNLYNTYYNYYSYSGNSNYLQQLQESEADPDKYLRTFGISLGYGKRLSWPDDYFSFYGELSYQMYMMKDWPYMILTDGNSHNFALNLQVSRSSIDNPIYTRRGSQFTLGLKITPPYSLIKGTTDAQYAQMTTSEKYHLLEYHKWRFSGKVFTPITPDSKLVLMTRAEFGYLGHYNKNAKSPFESFYMGGDGMSSYSSYSTEYISMRGYQSGSLTPYDAVTGRNMGYVYNKFTMELRYPISLEQNATIWALAFVEAGNCFADIKDYNPFKLKRSAGVGVRLFLPMFGLMGIDWGWGFDPINGSNQYGGSQFHFVLGQEL